MIFATKPLAAALVLLASAPALVACSEGGASAKDKKAKPAANDTAADLDDENAPAGTPAQVSGAFLVDCGWGDKVDDEHAQVACLAHTDADKTGASLADPLAGLTWHMIDGKGNEIAEPKTPPAGLANVSVIFDVPAKKVAEGVVIARRGNGSDADVARDVLKSSLEGLDLQSVVSCLLGLGKADCVQDYLSPITTSTDLLTGRKSLNEVINDLTIEDPGAGEPLAGLVTSGRYEGKMVNAIIGSAGAGFFCDEKGVRQSSGFEAALIPRIKERLVLDKLAEPTCFKSIETLSALFAGAVRLSEGVMAGPHNKDGKPLCYFAMMRGPAGKKPSGEEHELSPTTLVMIENPEVFKSATNVAGFNAANLVATVAAHPCPRKK